MWIDRKCFQKAEKLSTLGRELMGRLATCSTAVLWVLCHGILLEVSGRQQLPSATCLQWQPATAASCRQGTERARKEGQYRSFSCCWLFCGGTGRRDVPATVSQLFPDLLPGQIYDLRELLWECWEGANTSNGRRTIVGAWRGWLERVNNTYP